MNEDQDLEESVPSPEKPDQSEAPPKPPVELKETFVGDSPAQANDTFDFPIEDSNLSQAIKSIIESDSRFKEINNPIIFGNPQILNQIRKGEAAFNASFDEAFKNDVILTVLSKLDESFLQDMVDDAMDRLEEVAEETSDEDLQEEGFLAAASVFETMANILIKKRS